MSKIETGGPFGLRLQPDLKSEIQVAATSNNRSLNSEIVSRLSASLSQPNPAAEIEDQMCDNLTYKAPKTEEMSRRVYVLPVDLVKRIHAYGYEKGHQSEVSAVRELLDAGLAARGGDRD